MNAEARFGPLLWGVLGALACLSVSGFEPNLLEEGIELHVAERLASGERLYRDVFAFTGPLPYELLGWLFRIFGEEIFVARGAVVVMHGLASAAAFALARAAHPGGLAHAAAAATASAPLLGFPLFHIYYYTTMAFHLSVVAAWAANHGTRRFGWAVAAGVLVALVALCKQTLGLAVAVALGLALLRAGAAGRRAWLGFVIGGAATALATLSLWQAAGTLPHALHGLLTLPASLDDSFRMPFVNLWPPGEFSGVVSSNRSFYLPTFYVLSQGLFTAPTPRAVLMTQVLFAIPLLSVGLSALRIAQRGVAPALVIHAALSASWLVNLIPRADWGHLIHVLPLATAQLFLVIPVSMRSTWLPRVERIAAGLTVLAFVAASGVTWRFLDREADAEPFSTRVPLRPIGPGVRGYPLRQVVGFLERYTQRGEAIFVARAEPLIYFATDTKNPTPFPGIFPAMREEQEAIILEALRDVRFVVMSDVDQPALTHYRDELPGVQAYLERHYQPIEALGDDRSFYVTVLERGADRGGTLVDFVALSPEGRSFVRAEGERRPVAALETRLPTRRNRRPLGFRLGPDGGGIEFDLDVPPGAVFEADASLGGLITADRLLTVPEYSTVVVSIGRGEVMTRIAELELGGYVSPRWIPIEADLGAWANQRVTMRFELIRSPDEGPSGMAQIGYLGSPRLARRPAPRGRPQPRSPSPAAAER
jgi:hypothetical protein